MRTFVEVLRDNAVYTEHAHTFVRMDGTEIRVPFPELWQLACQRAHRFHELGLKKGDRVALILPEPDSFVLAFLGALTAGLVPVPMYPPLTLAKMEAYGETVRHILESSGAQALVTVPGLRPMLEQHLVRATEADVALILDADLEGAPMAKPYPPVKVEPNDLAFLQFTSGSTRQPKGVMVTHHNLSVNAHAIMFDGLRSTAQDRGVSWLPLFHDMGLIGFVIAPLFAQVQVMFLPTMSFIRRPSLWLEAIDRFRGSITFAPNFAYALATRAVKESQSKDWDLSCIKALGCGAEPIQADVMREFVARFAENGLREGAVLPCYGLAEATLAVSFNELDEPLKSRRVCPEGLKQGVAKPANGHGAVEIVSCGRPFPGHEIRIVDDAGAPLPERRVGHILLCGPSVTAGYFGLVNETVETFGDGWLRTGDLGYLDGGEIFICGRAKDLIIIHGKNYYPQDVERVAAEAYGVRTDQCVAFSRSGRDGEECVLVCETPKVKTDQDHIVRLIKQRVRSELGLTVAEVVVIKRNSMPKTSSGKVRRREAKLRLEQESLDFAPPASIAPPPVALPPAPRPSAPAL
jgi:fatty-acyl-CoA synthase